jgi:biopolymer transport protein ExbD
MARKGRKFGAGAQPFSMTSMMDMMTIILVFLIKQVDTEGQLVTAASNLVLPVSSSTKTPKEVNLTVIVDAGHIVVDNQKVVETSVVAAQDSLMVKAMGDVLTEKREEEKKHALAKGESADEAGNVIVQLDKNLNYDVMYKVMATCGFAGYSNVAFAVQMKNGGAE